jgi:hypothetical protein
MILNNEMESKWEEAVVTRVKVLFGHLPGMAGEKHERP